MPWQVVTYAFLHGSVGHLFFNMLGLWMFGSELERLWGGKRYPVLFRQRAFTAALTQLVVGLLIGGAPHRGGPRRAVRPAAGLRHDVPEPHHHAAVPAHPDEGQDLRDGVRRPGAAGSA